MKTFKLTKETDPRCAEYYAKAFPNLSKEEQDTLRLNWIKNNVKKQHITVTDIPSLGIRITNFKIKIK